MPWPLYYPFLMGDLITLEWSESNLARFVVETWCNYDIITSLSITTKKILNDVNIERGNTVKKEETE